MKLEKAIEICTDITTNPSYTHYPDKRDAIKLGIAALKRVKSLRTGGLADRYSILPGETED